MDVHDRLAWKLRAIRVKRRLSQDALAADASVDRAYVGRLERKLENPTIEVLEKLAGALDVDVAELLTKPPAGAPEPKPLKGGRKKSARPKRPNTRS